VVPTAQLPRLRRRSRHRRARRRPRRHRGKALATATARRQLTPIPKPRKWTHSSSKKFEASYAEFSVGATKLIQGLTGMGQYLDTAASTFQDADAQLAASLK
jgi:uncharacterized protein YukE